ncbi:hypothetical protein [Burkholderia anthina]|uniref:hypothetical protein n=1 Tax=Burkholderia anthina TaxID=179879 RepID=UPI001FC88A20|nr:hypothetical protein [Burkholderia anthina]
MADNERVAMRGVAATPERPFDSRTPACTASARSGSGMTGIKRTLNAFLFGSPDFFAPRLPAADIHCNTNHPSR